MNFATPESASRKPRVAFVVQRCGREVNGGAELHCLQVADQMSKWWDTEVLTTCALDYMRWENHYPPGLEKVRGTAIRRFLVDEGRDIQVFNQISGDILRSALDVPLDVQESWMRAQGPISSGLLDYLRTQRDSYDLFVFFGYLYATTYFGLPLVAEKACLAPLAHDEWPIYMRMWDKFFALPRQFVFNTKAERAFVQKRFAKLSPEGEVAGIGIDEPPPVDPAAFRKRHGLNEPFLLYVGRVDRSKGCDTLFDYYCRARADGATASKLVLIGQDVLRVPFHEDIIHLGFVSEEEKWEAMAACDWLVNPSPHESLSIVLLEAWRMGRPAIVNGASDVLRDHCQDSDGGLWYDSYRDWRAILERVSQDEKETLGRQGMAYVQSNYSWPRVEALYRELLSGERANG